MRRNWWPCRECGANHNNPMSSSLCADCGAAVRENREAAERSEEHEAAVARQTQELEDDKFLDELAYQLQNVSRPDLDKLIDLITRRINNGENT